VSVFALIYLPIRSPLSHQHPVIGRLIVCIVFIAAFFPASYLLTFLAGHPWRWNFLDEAGTLRSGWKAILFFLGYGIAMMILALPVGIVFYSLKGDLATSGNSSSVALAQVALIISGLAALGASFFCLALEKRPLHSVGFRFNARWFRDLILGTGFGILIMVLTALTLLGFGGFHWECALTGSWKTIVMGFLFFLAVGVHEETAFRGYPFQRVAENIGAWPTQVIFALIFGYIHLSNPGIKDASLFLRIVTTLNISLAAILLGLCYLKTRSLALPIGVHLGWNWTQGSVLGFAVSGTTEAKGLLIPILHDQPQWLTGGPVGLEGSVLCTLVCLGVILGLALWKPEKTEAQGA
jgi:hypothetical protein